MRTTGIVLSAMLFTFSAVGAAIDSGAAERYRVKSGRYTESVQGIKNQKIANRTEPRHNKGWCPYMKNAFKTEKADPASFEARYRAKYGRATPLTEARENKAREQAQAHVRCCVKLDMCTLISAHAPERVSEETPLDSAAPPMHCDHDCCKHGG